MKSKLALVSCFDYDLQELYKALKRAVDLLGGINNFIRPKSKVLVKPNLLQPALPQQAITTHPELIRAVIRILKEIDCEIYLGDSPSSWNKEDIEEVYLRCGIKKIAKEEKIELINFNQPVWKNNFPLTKYLDLCDYFISLPKFKTHNFTILTGAIKNLFGLVCGPYKIELHRKYPNPEDFSKMLIDLYLTAKPDLTIVDGIWALEADGPATKGIPKNTGFILVGNDGVSIDVILALLMGLKPQDIPTNQEAKKRNLSNLSLEDIEILGDNLFDFLNKDFKLPSTSLLKKIPSPILKVLRELIKFYPKIKHKNCSLCGRCISICPQKAIEIKNKRIHINYSQCIHCFCCQEVCIYKAIIIKKSILAKLLGLMS